MAKAGMKRPNPKEPHGTESNRKTHIPKNSMPPVPEIQGEAKFGNVKANVPVNVPSDASRIGSQEINEGSKKRKPQNNFK